MLIAIRISGQVKMNQDVQEALFRLRLRKKFTATLLKDTPLNRNLLRQYRNFIAYGIIDQQILEELIAKRGKSISGKKLNAAEVAKNLEQKSPQELDLKPFFALHPPRGGIDTKLHFPKRKGVLGDHKEKIAELVRRML